MSDKIEYVLDGHGEVMPTRESPLWTTEEQVDLDALREKMTRLRDLTDLYGPVVAEMEQLEKIITATLLTIDEKDVPFVPRLCPKYSEGRGSYDWEAIALALGVPQPVLDKHTTPSVAWRPACMEVGVPMDIQMENYRPGKRSVKLEYQESLG